MLCRLSAVIKTVLLAAFLQGSAMAAADEAQCIAAVRDQHYERLSTVCIDLPHRNRMKKMELMMSGEYTHYLGTVERPSTAFSMLRESAISGDHQAQYMYGLLYSTVHFATDISWPTHAANDGKMSLERYNERIHAEAARWARMAAEGGHTLAMLDVAEDILRRSYLDNQINLVEALQIARRAKKENPALADDLIARINERIKKINDS